MNRAAWLGAVVAIAGLGAFIHAGLQAAPGASDPLGEKTGGETTVFANGKTRFRFRRPI